MKYLIAGCALCCGLSAAGQDSLVTVHFEFNKSVLTPVARARLDSLITEEKKSGLSHFFELSGHCDSIGPLSYNKELSKRRVFEVHNYLLNHGLVKTQFRKIDALGETSPVNTNNTEEERLQNRRVEIRVQKINMPGSAGNLIEKIRDTATVAGSNIVLKNINFYGGMHTLLPESEPALRELLESMQKFPSLEIRIEGHICCQNGPQDGMDNETGLPNLSFARAKAVRDYLVVNGIDPNRVQYIGFGHSAPVYPYPEKSEEERIMNRRVEIKILRK